MASIKLKLQYKRSSWKGGDLVAAEEEEDLKGMEEDLKGADIARMVVGGWVRVSKVR